MRNIRSHLDSVLEENQLSSSMNEDNEEDVNDSLDKIESYLIKCIKIICHAIDSNNQKVKNVCNVSIKFHDIFKIIFINCCYWYLQVKYNK